MTYGSRTPTPDMYAPDNYPWTLPPGHFPPWPPRPWTLPPAPAGQIPPRTYTPPPPSPPPPTYSPWTDTPWINKSSTTFETIRKKRSFTLLWLIYIRFFCLNHYDNHLENTKQNENKGHKNGCTVYATPNGQFGWSTSLMWYILGEIYIDQVNSQYI